MFSYFFFDSTDSIVETLWDAMLAYFISKISLVYFGLTFATWTILSWSTESLLLRSTTTLASAQSGLFATTTLQLLSTVILARSMVVYYGMPPIYWFRLAVGGVSLGLMVLANTALAVLLLGGASSNKQGVEACHACLPPTTSSALLLAAFALMPTAQMPLEALSAQTRAWWKEAALSNQTRFGDHVELKV